MNCRRVGAFDARDERGLVMAGTGYNRAFAEGERGEATGKRGWATGERG
jgi:hypothetical protein